MKEIRTRIAPSPTGMMHLGTARTAIYCWAYARHFVGGKFLLRIEDTDQERSTQEAVDVIINGMKWLELDYDEGPIYQMDRLNRYKEVVDMMLEKGLAYKCYATKEELDALREEQMAKKIKPFRKASRLSSVSAIQIRDRWAGTIWSTAISLLKTPSSMTW